MSWFLPPSSPSGGTAAHDDEEEERERRKHAGAPFSKEGWLNAFKVRRLVRANAR